MEVDGGKMYLKMEKELNSLHRFFASPGNKYLTFLPIFMLSAAHDYFKIHNLKRLKIKNSN